MSFLGFHALQQAQQGLPGTSPQKIGAFQQHQQPHEPHQQQHRLAERQTRSGSVEVQKLTKQYQEEAGRLSEQLSLSGVPTQSLSLEAMSDLKQLAQLYCALKVTQASPQVLLAAWGMLLVNHSKATIMHHKVQQELRLIQHKRAAARQTLSVLQKVLSSVQASQEKEAKHEHSLGKQARATQERQATYPEDIMKVEQKLERHGFTEEITHQALLDNHSRMQELQQKLQGLQQRLNKYHGLPATVLGTRLKLDELKAQLEKKQARCSQLADDF